MQRVIELVRKEFRQLRRDRQMMPMMLVAPVIQLIVFAFAISTDIRNLPVAVCDMDRTASSRDLIRELTSSEYFRLIGRFDRHGDADRWLDEGRASVIIIVPRGFERDLKSGDTADLQVLLDGSDPNTATVAMSYLSRLIQSRSVRILSDRSIRSGRVAASSPSITAETRTWYNPTLASALFMVPGAMCVIIGMSATIATALAIVREREIGTMEQLIVTPLQSWELMLGKTLPYLAVGMVNMAAILIANALIFHVPVRGSLTLLLALGGVFLIASLYLGLLISTLSRTQQQAMLTAFFFLMPNFLLSGFMFPIANMPQVLQWATTLLPLRYFLVMVRGIFLKGSGFSEMTDQFWPLTIITVAIGVVAVSRFQKRLD
ncbi:MAG: ABC transporter permease [Chthonomonadales bacterium]|nr:ABC transporter permease [Chthonomonadales bacterium]